MPTPAGVPVLEIQVRHADQVIEGGLPRQLEFVLDAVAVGDAVQTLAKAALGSGLELAGFLAPRGRRSTRIRVHIQEVAFIGA